MKTISIGVLLLMVASGCELDTSLTVEEFEQKYKESHSYARYLTEQEAAAVEEFEPSNTHSGELAAVLPRFTYPEDGVFETEELFTLSLRDTDLESALGMIAEMGGKSLVFQGVFTDSVELTFRDERLDDIFRSLLMNYQCRIEEAGGMYVVSRYSPHEPVRHLFQLKSGSLEKIKPGVDTLLGSAARLVECPDGHSFMLTAPPDVLESVAAYLDTVDRPEKQVVIEVQIMDLLLSDLLELGSHLEFLNIDIDSTTSQFLTNFMPLSPDATFSITNDRNNINGTLSFLEEITSIELLARPKVVAKHGEEAKIEVIEEVPYVDATTTTTGSTTGVNTATVEEVEFKEVGIKMTVTPYVLGDDSVELKIEQDESEQIGEFNEIPVVDHRFVNTRCVVKNGQTVILGGLIKTIETEAVNGIPLLMDIPFLGYLFKYRSKEIEKRELIILLSPTVVDAGPGIAVEPPMTSSEESGMDDFEGI
jgi:type II secretory pathway component GspD/PulD (secretin)